MVSIIKALPSKKETRLVSSEFEYGSAGARTSGDKTSTPKKSHVGSLRYDQMRSMYEVNVWVRACVDRIVSRASTVKPIMKAIIPKGKFKPTDEQKKRMDEINSLIRKPNSMGESFQDIRKKVFRDIQIYDAGSQEWIRDINNKIVEMYSVAGYTIRPNVNDRGVFADIKKAYEQVDNTEKHLAWLHKNEICYMRAYPRSNNVYGLSPLETLQQTVTAELFAADFNLTRFINDATPRFAVLMGGLGVSQTGPAIERFRHWWDGEMKGNPHRPMILASEGDKIDFVKVGLTNEEMQFQQYSLWLLKKIMAVYNMQPFVLGVIEGTTGKLNSQQQEENFKKDAIKPLLELFSWHFNTEVIWADDSYNWDDIYLHWEGIDILDEAARAEIHDKYLKLGVFTINHVLNELGLDGVPWGNIPYMQVQYQPLGYSSDVATRTAPKLPDVPKPNQKAEKLFNALEIEPVRMKEAITKILNDREKKLNQYWSFPDEIGIGQIVKLLGYQVEDAEVE